jgi:hypothetical protein
MPGIMMSSRMMSGGVASRAMRSAFSPLTATLTL